VERTTWSAIPGNGGFDTSANWSTGTVPVGAATFESSDTSSPEGIVPAGSPSGEAANSGPGVPRFGRQSDDERLPFRAGENGPGRFDMMPGRRSFCGIGRRGLLAAAGSLLAAPSNVRARRRDDVALVIGNSKYQ
jgi:hypothetical protein